MDFHSMKRRDLQSLCKKHDLPAGGTNLEMVDRLESYLKKPEVTRPSKKVRFNFVEEESESNDLKNNSEGGGVQRRSSMKPGSEKTTQVVPGRMTRSRRGAEVAMLPASPVERKRAKRGVDVEGNGGGEKKEVSTRGRKGKDGVVEKRETRSGAVEEKEGCDKKEVSTRSRRGEEVVVPDLDLLGKRQTRRGRKDVSVVNVVSDGKSGKDGGEKDGGGRTTSVRNREVKGVGVNSNDEDDVVEIPDFEPSARSRKRRNEHVTGTQDVKEDSVMGLKPEGRATRQSKRTALTNDDADVVAGKKRPVAKGKFESKDVNEESSNAVEPEGRPTRQSNRTASTNDNAVVVEGNKKSSAKGKVEPQVVNQDSSNAVEPEGRNTRQSKRTASSNDDAVIVDAKKKSVAKRKIESQIVNNESSNDVEPEGRATRQSKRTASTIDDAVVVDAKKKSVAKGKILSQIVDEESNSAIEREGRAKRTSKRNASSSDAPVVVDRRKKSVTKGKVAVPEKETQYVTDESKDVVEPEGWATRKSKRDALTSDDAVASVGRRKFLAKGKVDASDKETQMVNKESKNDKKPERRAARQSKRNAPTDDSATSDGKNKPSIGKKIVVPDNETELMNEESKIVPNQGKGTRQSEGNASTNQDSFPLDGKSRTKGVIQKDASVAVDHVAAPVNAVQLIKGESKLEQTPRSSRRRTAPAVADGVPFDVPLGSTDKQKLGQSFSKVEVLPKTSHIGDSKCKSIAPTNVTVEQSLTNIGHDIKEAESVALTNVELSTAKVERNVKMQKQQVTETVANESHVSMTSPTSELPRRSTRGASKRESIASDSGLKIIDPNTLGVETPVQKQRVTEIVIAESYDRKTLPISERSWRSTRGSSRRKFVAADSGPEVVVPDTVETETPVHKKRTVVTGGSEGHEPQDKNSSAKGRRGKSVSKQAEQKRDAQEEVDVLKHDLTDSIMKQALGCIKEVPGDVCQSVLETQSFVGPGTVEDLLVTEKENSQVGIENHPLLEGDKFDSINGSLNEESICVTIDTSAVKETVPSTSTCLEKINIASEKKYYSADDGGKPTGIQEVHAELASNVDRSALETAEELGVQDEEELHVSDKNRIGSAGVSRFMDNLDAADIFVELLGNAGDEAGDITLGHKDNASTLLEEVNYEEKEVEDKDSALTLLEEASYLEKEEKIHDYIQSYGTDHAKNDELAEVPSISTPCTLLDTGDGQFFKETSQQNAECSLAESPGHLGPSESDPCDSGKDGSIYMAKSDMSHYEMKTVETEEILVGSSKFLVEASSKKQTIQFISGIQEEYVDQEANLSPVHDFEDVDETSAVVQRQENMEEKTVEALQEDYEPDEGNLNMTPYEGGDMKETSQLMVKKFGEEHEGEAESVMIRDSSPSCRGSVTGRDDHQYSSSAKSISSGSNQECGDSEAQEREVEPFEHKEEDPMMGTNFDVRDVEIVGDVEIVVEGEVAVISSPSQGLIFENLKDEVKVATSGEMIELENDTDIIIEVEDAVGLQQIQEDMGEDADILQHFSNDDADVKNDAVSETHDRINSVLDEQISDFVFVASPGNVNDHGKVGTSCNVDFEDGDNVYKREYTDSMHQSHGEHIDGFAQGDAVSSDHEDGQSVAGKENTGISSFSESYNLNFSEGEDISHSKASWEPGTGEGDEWNLGIFDSNEHIAEVESHEKTSEVDLNRTSFQDARQCKETAESDAVVNKEDTEVDLNRTSFQDARQCKETAESDALVNKEDTEGLDSKGCPLGIVSDYEVILEKNLEISPGDFVAGKEETVNHVSKLQEATNAVLDEENCANVAFVYVEEEVVKQDFEDEPGNQVGNRDVSAQVSRFDDSDSDSDSDSDELDEEADQALDENIFDNPESMFVEEAKLETISREETDDGTSQDILLEQDEKKNQMVHEDEEAVGCHSSSSNFTFNEGECQKPSRDIENLTELESLEEISPETGDGMRLDGSDVQLESAAMVQGDEVSRNNLVAYGFTAWEIDILSEDNTAQGDATHMDSRSLGEPVEDNAEDTNRDTEYPQSFDDSSMKRRDKDVELLNENRVLEITGDHEGEETDEEIAGRVQEMEGPVAAVDEQGIEEAQSVTMLSDVANAETSLQYVPLEPGNTEVEESVLQSFGVGEQIVEAKFVAEDNEVRGETISVVQQLACSGVLEDETSEGVEVVKAAGPEVDQGMIPSYEEMKENTEINFEDEDVPASEEILTGNSPVVAPEEHCPVSALHGTHTFIDNIWKHESTSFLSQDSPQERGHHGDRIVSGQVDSYSCIGESMSTEEYVDQKHIEASVSTSRKDKSSKRLVDLGVNTMITQVDQLSDFEVSMSTAKFLDQDYMEGGLSTSQQVLDEYGDQGEDMVQSEEAIRNQGSMDSKYETTDYELNDWEINLFSGDSTVSDDVTDLNRTCAETDGATTDAVPEDAVEDVKDFSSVESSGNRSNKLEHMEHNGNEDASFMPLNEAEDNDIESSLSTLFAVEAAEVHESISESTPKTDAERDVMDIINSQLTKIQISSAVKGKRFVSSIVNQTPKRLCGHLQQSVSLGSGMKENILSTKAEQSTNPQVKKSVTKRRALEELHSSRNQ